MTVSSPTGRLIRKMNAFPADVSVQNIACERPPVVPGSARFAERLAIAHCGAVKRPSRGAIRNMGDGESPHNEASVKAAAPHKHPLPP
jgi:hypothetical protein